MIYPHTIRYGQSNQPGEYDVAHDPTCIHIYIYIHTHNMSYSHCCGRGVPFSHCCGLVVAFACGSGACWASLTTERYAGKRPARHFKGFKGLKPVKRQPWTPIRSHCCGRGDALSHCCGVVVAFACGRGACWACWGTVCLRSWALCMREWRVLGSVQANGRLQRWNSRGWRLQGLVQPAGGVLEAL